LRSEIVEEGEDADDAWANAREDLGRKVAGGTFDEALDISEGNTPAAEHVENEGAKCPACKSGQIEGDSISIEGKNAYQPMWCNSCPATWVDEYRLTGYAELKTD
jgi:hypothetical protein